MKCPRTVKDGKDRCRWEGDDPTEHAAEHQLCVCSNITRPHFLRDSEVRCCSRCVNGALEDLQEITDAYATLPAVIEASGYRMRGLPGGNALVMFAHGSVEGGGPDDDIRYHDPIPVLADLHSWERDWRETFGHHHAPAWRATVVTTVGYLREWMWLAARTHDGFDDYVRDVRTLRSRLTHTTGLANDPDRLPAECVDCGDDLLREYRPPTTPVSTPRRMTREGYADEGRADDATCRGCGRVYKPAEYGWSLIARAASCSGWVTVRMAAETSRRPEQTIWRWVREAAVPAACRLTDRRVVVEWEFVKARSDESGRRNHEGKMAS